MSHVFTVALPTYNRVDLLKTNLPLILKQISSLDSEGELLVIDDGSTDDSRQLLEKLRIDYPTILRFIIQPNNQGITKTRNLLVKEANGKFIIFIDSDITPAESLFSAHLKTLSARKNIISQGSLILVSELNEIYQKKANPLTDYSRAFFATANVAVEKENIISAGFFDENFSGYGWEDLELGIRLKKQGIKVVRNKDAYGYHYEPYVKLKELDKFIFKEKARAKGAIYFAKKHPLLEVKLMTQLTWFHFFLDKALTKILGFENPSFLNYLARLEEEKNYNMFIPLLRIYLNHFNILEMQKLIKHI